MESLLATLAVLGLLAAAAYILVLFTCALFLLFEIHNGRKAETVNITWEVEPEDELEEMLSRPERFSGFIDAERVGWLP